MARVHIYVLITYINEPVMQEANDDTPVVVDISTTGLWQPHLVCCGH